MAKGGRGRRRMASRLYRQTPYPLPSYDQDVLSGTFLKKSSTILEKRDWEDALCSVCMEFPHNAALLLCSSYGKGCRPYMCGTSFRFSNCLDQYKTAYSKVSSSNENQILHRSSDNQDATLVSGWPTEKCEVTELACPLCRGQVKGWTVVEPARNYLNAKRRSCMQDTCSFVGNYKEMRKHVRTEHPCARPREVDPLLEQKWRRFEHEREQRDVLTTIRSSIPDARFFGDYVIEGPPFGFYPDDEGLSETDAAERDEGFEIGSGDQLVNVVLLLHAFGPAGNAGANRVQRRESIYHLISDEEHAVADANGAGGSDSSHQGHRDGDYNTFNSSTTPLVDNHRRRLHLDRNWD